MPKASKVPTHMGNIRIRSFGDGGLDNKVGGHGSAVDRGGVANKKSPEGRHGKKVAFRDSSTGNRGMGEK